MHRLLLSDLTIYEGGVIFHFVEIASKAVAIVGLPLDVVPILNLNEHG